MIPWESAGALVKECVSIWVNEDDRSHPRQVAFLHNMTTWSICCCCLFFCFLVGTISRYSRWHKTLAEFSYYYIPFYTPTIYHSNNCDKVMLMSPSYSYHFWSEVNSPWMTWKIKHVSQIVICRCSGCAYGYVGTSLPLFSSAMLLKCSHHLWETSQGANNGRVLWLRPYNHSRWLPHQCQHIWGVIQPS